MTNFPPEPDSALAPGVTAPPRAIRWQFSRGAGPGGQNVNKVNTRAELWVDLNQIIGLNFGAIQRLRDLAGGKITDAGELHLVSGVHRTQEGNRREIMQRLRELLVQASVVPKRRRKTRPTAGSKRRRLESKRHRSELKAQRGPNL